MEDKKVLEFINKNHNKCYKEFVKNQKKKKNIKKILMMLSTIIFLILFIWLLNMVCKETQQNIVDCMNDGYGYNYCAYKANN